MIWADLFKALSVAQMTKDGITGVRVPDSQFVVGDLATARSMSLVLQRIRGASTGGTVTTGLHGTNIVSVKALPGGQTLSPDSLNTVTATTDLVFAVTVKDSGDFQEVQIPVTLTIQKTGGPIVQTQKIQLINPGERGRGELRRPRLRPVRAADDAADRREAGRRRGEEGQQHGRVPGHLLAARLIRACTSRRQQQRSSRSPGARSGSPASLSRGSRG